MSTITRERIEQLANGNNICKVTREERVELARIALASLEAEPVAHIFKHPAGRLFWSLTDESNNGQSDVMPVYTAPPAPVSVPDRSMFEKWWESEHGSPFDSWDSLRTTDGYCDDGIDGQFEAWNACRAAMLQGAEQQNQQQNIPQNIPVNTPCKEAPEHIWLQTAGVWPENGELSELTWCRDNQHEDDTLYVRADVVTGNSPVIPDGWVACSERMPEIYTWVHVYSPSAYIAEQILPDRLIEVGDPENGPFWDYHGREGVTHWMPLPAAPQQEVKP